MVEIGSYCLNVSTATFLGNEQNVFCILCVEAKN